MSASPKPGLYLAEVRFDADLAAVVVQGKQVVYDYWRTLDPYYGQLLLQPQWRSAEERATWTWQQPGGAPAGAPEMAELRARLVAANDALPDEIRTGAAGPATATGLTVEETSRVVLTRTLAIVRALVARSDEQLAGYVCRTEAGLRLHSWGAAEPAHSFLLSQANPRVLGRVEIEVETAGDRRPDGQIVLENMRGIQIGRIRPDAEGSFVFPSVASGRYRVRPVFSGVVFGVPDLAINVLYDDVTDVVLRGVVHRDLPTSAILAERQRQQHAMRRRRNTFAGAALLLLLGCGVWFFMKRPSGPVPVAGPEPASSVSPDLSVQVPAVAAAPGTPVGAPRRGALPAPASAGATLQRGMPASAGANRSPVVPLDADTASVGQAAATLSGSGSSALSGAGSTGRFELPGSAQPSLATQGGVASGPAGPSAGQGRGADPAVAAGIGTAGGSPPGAASAAPAANAAQPSPAGTSPAAAVAASPARVAEKTSGAGTVASPVGKASAQAGGSSSAPAATVSSRSGAPAPTGVGSTGEFTLPGSARPSLATQGGVASDPAGPSAGQGRGADPAVAAGIGTAGGSPPGAASAAPAANAAQPSPAGTSSAVAVVASPERAARKASGPGAASQAPGSAASPENGSPTASATAGAAQPEARSEKRNDSNPIPSQPSVLAAAVATAQASQIAVAAGAAAKAEPPQAMSNPSSAAQGNDSPTADALASAKSPVPGNGPVATSPSGAQAAASTSNASSGSAPAAAGPVAAAAVPDSAQPASASRGGGASGQAVPSASQGSGAESLRTPVRNEAGGTPSDASATAKAATAAQATAAGAPSRASAATSMPVAAERASGSGAPSSGPARPGIPSRGSSAGRGATTASGSAAAVPDATSTAPGTSGSVSAPVFFSLGGQRDASPAGDGRIGSGVPAEPAQTGQAPSAGDRVSEEGTAAASAAALPGDRISSGGRLPANDNPSTGERVSDRTADGNPAVLPTDMMIPIVGTSSSAAGGDATSSVSAGGTGVTAGDSRAAGNTGAGSAQTGGGTAPSGGAVGGSGPATGGAQLALSGPSSGSASQSVRSGVWLPPIAPRTIKGETIGVVAVGGGGAGGESSLGGAGRGLAVAEGASGGGVVRKPASADGKSAETKSEAAVAVQEPAATAVGGIAGGVTASAVLARGAPSDRGRGISSAGSGGAAAGRSAIFDLALPPLRVTQTVANRGWKSRMLEPDEPTNEVATVQTIRRRLLADGNLKVPRTLLEPRVTAGFAVEWAASAAAEPPAWVDSARRQAVGGTVRDNRAELAWDDGGAAASSDFALVRPGGAVLARVSIERDGRATLWVAEDVRGWYWVGVLRDEDDDRRLAAPEWAQRLDWRLLDGQPLPAGWRRDDAWQGGHGHRLDMPPERAPAGSLSLALVDRFTGWALVHEHTRQTGTTLRSVLP